MPRGQPAFQFLATWQMPALTDGWPPTPGKAATYAAVPAGTVLNFGVVRWPPQNRGQSATAKKLSPGWGGWRVDFYWSGAEQQLLGAVAEERTRKIPGVSAPTEADVAAWTTYIKQPGASLTEWTSKILPALRSGGVSTAGGGWFEQELVPGIKNLYLLIGSGGLFLLLAAAKRRR